MPVEPVKTGKHYNDPTADRVKDAFDKTNRNVEYLNAKLDALKVRIDALTPPSS